MEANELRIGNWIKGAYEFQVTEIRANSIYSIYEPIPLTPEILEACRFVKARGQVTFWYYTIRTTQFSFRLLKDGLLIYKIDSSFNLEINSLHQLQNLYFALTGEELEVKLNEPYP